MNYPYVCDEQETLDDLLLGQSIARFGDGELKLALGRDCVSQHCNPSLREELSQILFCPNDSCLTGIPRITPDMPKYDFWHRYEAKKYTDLYNHQKAYHSSFITRPDNQPAINNPEYWDKVVNLWRNRNVMLVTGGRSSALRKDTMPEARNIFYQAAPETDAYSSIDCLEKEIRVTHAFNSIDVVMLCLGATATCLAWRLSNYGVQALDLGHIAMFYRRYQRGESMVKK